MRITKTMLSVCAVFLGITIGCIKNNPVSPDVEAVATDASVLVITYAPGDSAGSVTGNVVLPASGLSGSSISWATGNGSCITIDGMVNRPAAGLGDISVLLTATISKGSVSNAKEFSLTVKDLGYTGNIMSAGTVTDIEGNGYWAVKIGSQIWTVENLRTTKYNDGSAIALVQDSAAWVNLGAAGYCYFNNMVNADSIRKYGMLYTWYAVDTKRLAPAGWHVPTDAEWNTLTNYLITNGYNSDGTTDSNRIAKSLSAKTDWYSPAGLEAGAIGNNLSANNSSGFLALPGGSRGTDGNFDFGGSGNWWSATEYNESGAVARNLYYNYANFFWNSNYKSCGFSVRLVKD